MLESERTSAQELESLWTSFNAGWYRKPSIVNNLKKTFPINKNSYTHNLQEQQQQNKSRKNTMFKDCHIIQNCHSIVQRQNSINKNPLFWFVEMWSLLRSNLTTSLYVKHAMLTSYLTPSWNKHRSTSVVSNTFTRTILAGDPAKAGKQPLARASAQPSLILHTSTLSKYL